VDVGGGPGGDLGGVYGLGFASSGEDFVCDLLSFGLSFGLRLVTLIGTRMIISCASL